MNIHIGLSFALACIVSSCSAELTEINCIDKGCGTDYAEPGMKCCKYEGLQSDEFAYDNIQTTTQFYVNYRNILETKYSLDIQKFVIVGSNISKIPKNLFQNIKELKQLDVVVSGVRNIFVSDFDGANKLTHLNLTKNAIQNLEPKLFVYAQSLLVLDLSFNDITNLSEYTFDHLDQLKTLILSNNKIMAFDINQRFINLEVFSIHDNLLNTIGPKIFQNSTYLREINLRNNNLVIDELLLSNDVTLGTFDVANNFASVSISSKQISIQNTRTTSYRVREMVESLDASNNQISNIQFESSEILTKVNLSNNNLTSVRNITNLQNLQQLDLSFNAIKDFSIASFTDMNDLLVLNLKKSGLTTLDFGTFSQQTKLNFLDISDNNLKKINFDMFLSMSSLSGLYMDGNQLTNIDVSDLKNILPNLTSISISRNVFRCRDLISIMKTLSSLRINLHTVDGNVVKNSSNVRGIKCFSDSNDDHLMETTITDVVELPNNYKSNSNWQKSINNLHSKEILDLKNSFESLRKQTEKRFSEQTGNLSSLNQKLMSSTNQNHLIHGNESDSFQFAFTFLLIIVILFAFGLSIYFYSKLRARRRWYTAAKENSTSADQTLV